MRVTQSACVPRSRAEAIKSDAPVVLACAPMWGTMHRFILTLAELSGGTWRIDNVQLTGGSQ